MFLSSANDSVNMIGSDVDRAQQPAAFFACLTHSRFHRCPARGIKFYQWMLEQAQFILLPPFVMRQEWRAVAIMETIY